MSRESIEGALFRAALLAGCGAAARALAQRLAALGARGAGRSCLDAGAPLQFVVDAPGPARLCVGLRIDERVSAAALAGVMPAAAAQRLADALAALPRAGHASLGSWLFWSEAAQSLYVDLRDPVAGAALARLAPLLAPAQRVRLLRLQPTMLGTRPWVLQLHAGAASPIRLHLHWLLPRHARPDCLVEALAPGAWPRVVDVLGRLLRRPHASGRWVVATPLDEGGMLRIGNSGWSLVPEDDRKHRAVGELMSAFGGARDHAEALWSACRGAASEAWRVGRGCELEIDGRGEVVRVRLFFAPQLRGDAE